MNRDRWLTLIRLVNLLWFIVGFFGGMAEAVWEPRLSSLVIAYLAWYAVWATIVIWYLRTRGIKEE